MTLYGHDPLTGHLFAWDKEFKYAGRTTNPPGISFPVPDNDEDRLIACWSGAFFLAGGANPAWIVYASDTEQATAIAVLDSTGLLVVRQKKTHISVMDRVILCGPKVKDPTWVGQFCQRFSTNPMYVCPLVEELPAFGILVRELLEDKLDWPRRAVLYQPVTDELPFDGNPYEPDLEGDAYGRMAFVIAKDIVIHNAMMSGPGLSFFYGKMLASKPVFPDSVYVISPDSLRVFLPQAPVSLKLYAGTSVPVLAPVSEHFKKATGHLEDEAVIAVASDYIPGFGEFITFYGSITKRGVFCSGTLSSGMMTGKLPVFRYNKVYVADAKKYMELQCLL